MFTKLIKGKREDVNISPLGYASYSLHCDKNGASTWVLTIWLFNTGSCQQQWMR